MGDIAESPCPDMDSLITEGPAEETICLFPALAHLELHTVPFDQLIVRSIQSFTLLHDVDDHILLSGVWAMALYRFAEVEIARFGVYTPVRPDLKHPNDSTFTISLGPGKRFSEMLDVKHWKIQKAASRREVSFNTGVFILEFSTHGTLSEHVKYHDVNFVLRYEDVSPQLNLVYRSTIMSGEHAKHIVGGLSQAILSITSNCTQLIADIDICCPAQKLQLRRWQNDTTVVQPSESFLFQHVSKQATIRGNHKAVESWDGSFTYTELEKASTQVAFHLKGQGIGHGSMVPVCFEKTRWAIVAMLAINKTGAAFVPCDPKYPLSRLRSIIHRTGARVVLASSNTQDIFSSIATTTVVLPTTQVGHIYTQEKLELPTAPVAPAYCLFTSGSTGEPKGCEVSHKAFASIATHVKALRLDHNCRSLQFASLCFGASRIEIWCTLIAGGTICIPSDHDRLNALGTAMSRMKINWAFITPTVLRSLTPEEVGNITLFTAGEPLGDRDVVTWASKVKLFQAYGLTEWAGVFTVSKQIVSPTKGENICLPANARAWVVEPSDYSKLAPIGAVGELVIEGPSLASGYKDDPEKTDAAFFSHPSWISSVTDARDSSRVYRTGDLVRYAEDGSILYVRRKDSRVKVRGQLLDTSEVEYHIRQFLPQTTRTNVMLHEPMEGKSQQHSLIALTLVPHTERHHTAPSISQGGLEFIEVDENYKSQVEAVELGLRARLPEFMIPQLFLPVNSIPTTITGKVDRRALSREVNQLRYDELHQLAGLSVKMRAPRNELEENVHHAVSKVLSLPCTKFGMLDNFFHIGGSSVTAMKLAVHAKRLGLKVSVSDVFKNPVLADLAVVAGQSDNLPSAESDVVELIDQKSLPELRKLAALQCQISESHVEAVYPSTALQAGLVAMTARDPRMCQAQLVCKLSPNTELSRFKEAWNCVFQLNDILRTRFMISVSHGTLQVVVKETFEWDVARDLDACAQRASLTEARIGKKLVHAYLIPNDLVGQRQWSFSLMMHHALCDQWSLRLLMDQLMAAYKGLQMSQNDFKPFIKYVSEREPFFKDYWIRQFQDLRAVPFPSLPSPGYTPEATEEFVYDMALPGRPTESYTMATYLKLAWALVISFNTGMDDVVFGLTLNGRSANIDKIGEIAGPTFATVPQRVKLFNTHTVMQTLSGIQIQSLKTVPFEQAGLQNIQKYSDECKMACSFQSQLIIQPPVQEPPELFTGYEFSATAIGGFSAYGLSIECLTATDDQSCRARVTFDPNMISLKRVKRVLWHMELILRMILKDSRQKLSDLPCISEQDRDQLQAWNGNITSFCPSQCVHDIIDEQSVKYPNAPAVSAADGQISYSELSRLSTNLAAVLLNQGVTHGMYVPVLFEKSKWTTVALLGIIKAGAAFVLFDCSHPLQRLQTICKDIDCHVIVCSRSHTDKAEKLGQKMFILDDSIDLSAKDFARELTFTMHPSPENALYMAFTSGSTGNPKGIVIQHSSYCRSAEAHNKTHTVDQSSRVLQFASYAFDVSIMEMLSTLMAGGCVCVLSDSQRQDQLWESMEHQQVTHAFLTPSSTRVLKNQPIPSLRVLVMGGEPMSPEDVDNWVDKVQLMTEYGIAECSIASTACHVRSRACDPRNIGFPMGVAAWVVSPIDHQRLVPLGATGELLLEGPTVGSGYFNSPEATNLGFVDQPSWLSTMRQEKTRVYKTGDLVRYNDDGSLSFMGRKDAQIKIRGQRLELAEVEHQIRRFPIVREVAAVAAMPCDSQSAPCLAAFIVQEPLLTDVNGYNTGSVTIVKPTEAFQELSGMIQSELRSVLPDYMVPSVYLPVYRIPRTESGKFDRQTLKQEIERRTWGELKGLSYSTTPGRAPSTEIEQCFQAIWSQVLGIPQDKISVDSSFYDLGGDSISAMQVVAQARSQGLGISTHLISREKTISRISEQISTIDLGMLQQEELTDELFDLSPIQTFFFERYPQGTNQFNQNILVHLQQRVEVADIERATVKLVKYHSILRARFSQKNSTWKQSLVKPTEGCFQFRSHVVSSMKEMDQIKRRSQMSVDIATGPVFAVDLFELDGKQALFMLAHHLVIDLVSWRIILSDMEALIRDHNHKPDTALSFQTWSRLQMEYGEKHLAAADIYQLPCIDSHFMLGFWGSSHNPNIVGNSENRLIRIDEGQTHTLFGRASNALDVKPVELLHAAVLYSFVQTFPHRHVPCIYGKAHGREAWDTSINITRTVGCFTTLWPVMAQIDSTTELHTAVQVVKDARRRVANNGWSYFTSIYHNTERRRQSLDMPPIEITFNYAGKFQQVEQAGGLFRMEPISKQNIFDCADNLSRWAMFEINSLVLAGCLEFHMTFNRSINKNDILEPWMENFVKCLDALAQLR